MKKLYNKLLKEYESICERIEKNPKYQGSDPFLVYLLIWAMRVGIFLVIGTGFIWGTWHFILPELWKETIKNFFFQKLPN